MEKKYSHNVKVRGEKCLTGENSKRPSTIKYDTMELSLFDIVNMIFFNTDSWYNNTNNIQILGVVEVKYMTNYETMFFFNTDSLYPCFIQLYFYCYVIKPTVDFPKLYCIL